MKIKIIIILFVFVSSTIQAQTSLNCSQDSFSLVPGQQYILNGWVQDSNNQIGVNSQNALNFEGHIVITTLVDSETMEVPCYPSGAIIDGWQAITQKFTVPEDISTLEIKLVSKSGSTSYFDDIRIFPFNGNMKSFVYDPTTQRLMAELDENNYATFYEYDKEGGLIRVKKETEQGVYTIQETRSGNQKIDVDN
ncbi:MAG: hypothetical protein ACSHW7_00500 [Patiriisocius sp.]|uniref:hypothetical protein n=1 Tax=Patiriisocius sp. TaxID=2822396 RepID=UPI003EF3CFD5